MMTHATRWTAKDGPFVTVDRLSYDSVASGIREVLD